MDIKLLLLNLLHFTHYFIIITYLLLIFGIKYFYAPKRVEYIKVIDAFYRLIIGVLFVALSFPIIFTDIGTSKYKEELIRLMFPAGLIILSTVKYSDFKI